MGKAYGDLEKIYADLFKLYMNMSEVEDDRDIEMLDKVLGMCKRITDDYTQVWEDADV
jgi:flagellin-specific chaperone FliS